MQRSINNSGLTLILLGLAGFTLPLLSAALSGLSGVLPWLIDLAANWQPVFSLLVFIGVILLSIRRPVMLGLLGLSAIPLFTAHDRLPRATAGGDAIKILSANIHFENQDLSRLKALINKETPSLVTLLELSPTAAAELEKLENYPFKALYPENSPFGIGLLSKLPITEVTLDRNGLNELIIPTLQAVIDWHGSDINVVAFHPMPPINPDYHAARNFKLGQLSSNSLQSGMPTIIAGDFNASPWSSAFAGSELKRATGLASTWPSGLFGIAVDQVLASKQWHVYDFYVGTDTGSDHLPVIATLYGAGIAKQKPDSLLEELGIDLSENKKGSTFLLSLSNMEPVKGIEPSTSSLQVRRSTN